MKFDVRRTSWTFSEDAAVAPCLNAFESEGRWSIEIKDLQELIDFVKVNGDIVLSNEGISNEPEIEIYDGYRE